jgi:S1-C subfamily serine protease
MYNEDTGRDPRGAGSTLTLPPPPASSPPVGPTAARSTHRRGNPWLSALVAALVAVLVAVPTTLIVAGTPRGAAPAATPGAAPIADVDRGAGQAMPVEEVADTLLPSVALVEVQGARGNGAGSAVTYRQNGYLLTNAHVVAEAEAVRVTLPDGTPLEAEVVGADPASDLAVLRVDPDDLPDSGLPVPDFADELPAVGSTAVAIGSPFGLESTVTAGIVSAVARTVPGLPLTDAIQTDAPINPGNSGGALANVHGEVIGINSAILGANPSAPGNVGIGFAIPATTALPIAEQLIDQGFVEHPQLGIQGTDVDPSVADAYGLSASEGALVLGVQEGSAAAEAGLERGDIITGFGGEQVTSMPELGALVRAREPGEDVELTVVRGDDERTVTITLGTAPTPPR